MVWGHYFAVLSLILTPGVPSTPLGHPGPPGALMTPGMSWSLLIRQAQEKNGKGPGNTSGIEVLNLLYSRKVARCNFATLSIITLILTLQLYNNLLPALSYICGLWGYCSVNA